MKSNSLMQKCVPTMAWSCVGRRLWSKSYAYSMHNDVIIGGMVSPITGHPPVCSVVCWDWIKRDIKFRITGIFCRESTSDAWIPRTKASNAEYVFISWRGHALATSTIIRRTHIIDVAHIVYSFTLSGMLHCNLLYFSGCFIYLFFWVAALETRCTHTKAN